MKENKPLTLEAVALSFADPLTPRERVVGAGARHGDREERRTLEVSNEVGPYEVTPYYELAAMDSNPSPPVVAYVPRS